MTVTMMSKEYIEKLCVMSKRVFGARWKWQKLIRKSLAEPEAIEKEMQAIIDKQYEQMKQIKEQYEKSNKQLGNDSGSSVGDGGNQTEVSATGDGSSTSGYLGTKGEEIRSGEAEDGPTTPTGSI